MPWQDVQRQNATFLIFYGNFAIISTLVFLKRFYLIISDFTSISIQNKYAVYINRTFSENKSYDVDTCFLSSPIPNKILNKVITSWYYCPEIQVHVVSCADEIRQRNWAILSWMEKPRSQIPKIATGVH